MSVDLPEPETPVTHANTPSGKSTSIFLRLCCRAPTILIDEANFRRDFGMGIDLRPLRYSRVRDWGAHACSVLVALFCGDELFAGTRFAAAAVALDDCLEVREGRMRARPRKSSSGPFH